MISRAAQRMGVGFVDGVTWPIGGGVDDPTRRERDGGREDEAGGADD
jgi:hypothetical protein